MEKIEPFTLLAMVTCTAAFRSISSVTWFPPQVSLARIFPVIHLRWVDFRKADFKKKIIPAPCGFWSLDYKVDRPWQSMVCSVVIKRDLAPGRTLYFFRCLHVYSRYLNRAGSTWRASIAQSVNTVAPAMIPRDLLKTANVKQTSAGRIRSLDTVNTWPRRSAWCARGQLFKLWIRLGCLYVVYEISN